MLLSLLSQSLPLQRMRGSGVFGCCARPRLLLLLETDAALGLLAKLPPCACAPCCRKPSKGAADCPWLSVCCDALAWLRLLEKKKKVSSLSWNKQGSPWAWSRSIARSRSSSSSSWLLGLPASNPHAASHHSCWCCWCCCWWKSWREGMAGDPSAESPRSVAAAGPSRQL